MSATILKVESTPMGPYIGLMQGMSREDKQTVVTFLTELMEEQQAETNRDIIRKKYKDLKVSPELKRLRGCIKLTAEDLEDERTQYILNQ